jgi:uroporphyrinogen III methyltransferase/synthase
MGIAHLPAIVEQLLAGGRPPDTPVAIIREATTASQRTVVGRLADIVERAAGIQPPALIVVGEVVGLRDTLRWFDQPDRRPLWGVRVLNTRPGDQAAELSRRLAALGAEPVELPTTQIVPVADPGPLDRAIQHLLAGDEPHTRYDWIIFTSATAVTFFMNRLFELGHDARLLAGVRLGVVGQATADALRPYGLAADFLPSRQTGRDMAAEIGDVAGRRVLLPRSDMALPDSADILARRGAHVEPVVAYRVCPAEPDAPALAALLDGSIHVVTFFSPSALTGLAGMLGEQPLAQVLAGPAVACIGPTTAAAARQLGVRVDVVTQHASLDGLVDALVDWHARQIKG